MTRRFTLYNKNFYLAEDLFFTSEIFHAYLFRIDMKMANTKILFWDDYKELIVRYLHFYGVSISYPQDLMMELERQIQRCYVKNKLYKGLEVRLSFFLPKGELIYMIEVHHENQEIYLFDNTKLELIEHKQLYKTRSLLSSHSIGAEKIWCMAQAKCSRSGQIPLILDEKQNILEVPHANLFLIGLEKQVCTPHLSLGVCANPARDFTIRLLEQMGYEVKEIEELKADDLLQMRELFVVNDLLGVRPITSFQQQRYLRIEGNQIAQAFAKTVIDS